MGRGYTAPMRKAPRRITAAYLQRVTIHYLERYSSSRANLRRLLMRRVYRSAEHHGDAPEDGALLVDAELDRLQAIGLVNDGQYATDKARAMHRRGAGARKIRSALAVKGLPSDAVDRAIAALSEGGGDPELKAACTYARKRRVGPWRRAEADRDQRQKELAKLARAGFAFDLARRVVEAPTVEALTDPDTDCG